MPGLSRSLSCPLLLCALATGPLARAESAPDPKAAYAGAMTRTSPLEDTRARVDHALRAAAERHGVDVVKRSERATTRAAPPQVHQTLRRLLDTARGHFFAGQFKRAVRSADDGIARFESGPAYTDDEAAWNSTLS